MNGLPQGSVYTNEQLLHNGTHSFIYADTILQPACKPRQNPCYGVPPEEQRAEENVKGEVEQDRSGEHSAKNNTSITRR